MIDSRPPGTDESAMWPSCVGPLRFNRWTCSSQSRPNRSWTRSGAAEGSCSAAAEHEPSAAPLRVQLRFGLDWELHVHLLKRKGPTHERDVVLSSVPGGLEAILTPRLRRPSHIIASRQVSDDQREGQTHVVGSAAPRQPSLRRVTAH